MSLLSACQWLQDTSWARGIKESTLLFPFIEGSHILALSFSVGMVLILDLRLLRLAFRGERISLMMAELMPWTLTGFAVMMLTGFLLFAAQAVKTLGNPFFQLKMLLLLAAGANALYYQLRFYPALSEWDRMRVPFGVRLTAVLSLVLWAGVIVCGRTMAYEL
ncbi:MAG: DUF6644 family protein [Chloroflexota bacterium]